MEEEDQEAFGLSGTKFGFVLFLIVAAVGVIAAVKYMQAGREADLALYAAAATGWRCI